MGSGQWVPNGVSLKTVGIASPESRNGRTAASVEKRLQGEQRHLLIVFRAVPGQAEIEQLRQQGITVLQYVPERGLMATVPAAASLADLDVEWYGPLEPLQKLSPRLVDAGLPRAPAGDTAEFTILVEFHGDVSRGDMAAIAASEGVHLVENPNLVSWQAMVRGTAARLVQLAGWDEVLYLFPASRELESLTPAEACRGALTAAGSIGQLTARVGEGWDGDGKGSADLNYYFSSYTGRLSQEQVRSEILRAMREWASVVKVSFAPGATADLRRTINVLFASGEHRDGYAFDGAGKTLAHAFFPAPPNPETIAGDLHLDDDEPWQTASNIDLFSVALHELGHSLGLSHSDNPAAVMYPYYRRVSTLSADDIDSIREIYAAHSGTPDVATPGGTPSPTPTPAPAPVAPLLLGIEQPATVNTTTTSATLNLQGTTAGGSAVGQVAWTNQRGGSGVASGFRPWTAAVPLQLGENIITLIATDNAQARNSQQIRVVRETGGTTPAPAALSLRIVTPQAGGVYQTGQATVTLAGTAGPDGGVQRVSWASSQGSGGSVQGGASWITSPVALEAGMNRITVTATDGRGGSASALLDVQYTPPLPPPIDVVAPALLVTSPTSATFATPNATLVITGTATDNTGVTEVNWVNGTGQSGKASGTSVWRIDYPLQMGINTIVVRAHDAAGNFSWRSLAVVRQ